MTPRDWWFWSEGVPLWTSDNKNMPDEIRGPVEFLQFVNGYDGGVNYADTAIGQVLELLEQLGVRDETAVIVSSDHGEAIGELGMYFDHGNASEGVHHLPLVVDWPGQPAAFARRCCTSSTSGQRSWRCSGCRSPRRWTARLRPGADSVGRRPAGRTSSAAAASTPSSARS